MLSPSQSVEEQRGSPGLRTAILNAATRLFAERGYAATSMREVAEAANCTKPAVYYYFDGKAALFLAAIRFETECILRILGDNLSEPGSVRERLRTAMTNYFAYVTERPHALKVLYRAEMIGEKDQPAFDFATFRQEWTDLTMRLLEHGVTSGEIRRDVNLEDALHALAGVVDMRCTTFMLHGVPIPRDCAQRALAILFAGISG